MPYIPIRKASAKNATRRRIAFNGETPEGIAEYGIKSRTRPNVKHTTHIDLQTGSVFCSCEWFTFRCTRARLGHDPSISDFQVLCHHAQRAIGEALRHERF